MTLVINKLSDLERIEFYLTLYDKDKIVFSTEPLRRLVQTLTHKKAEIRVLKITKDIRPKVLFHIKFFYSLNVTSVRIDGFLDKRRIYTRVLNLVLPIRKGDSLDLTLDLRRSF